MAACTTIDSIAVALCTYRPDPAIVSRALDHIAALQVPGGVAMEYIIIDNNSPEPLADLPVVQAFLQRVPNATIIRETRQGLTYARLAAFRASRAGVLVYFDDDNLPEREYLLGVKHLIESHSVVAVWGPGRIAVEFADPVPRWIEQAARGHFQETDHPNTDWGCMVGWAPYYPAGTGQVVRRDVMARYAAAVESGELSATDRQGNSLASAGDGQIVWSAVKAGLAAGRSPLLRLTHLIPGSRCNSRYLARLNYGVNSSAVPAMVQAFRDRHLERSLTKPQFARTAAFLIRQVFVRGRRGHWPMWRVDAAGAIGAAVAYFAVTGNPLPAWVKSLRQVLRLNR